MQLPVRQKSAAVSRYLAAVDCSNPNEAHAANQFAWNKDNPISLSGTASLSSSSRTPTPDRRQSSRSWRQKQKESLSSSSPPNAHGVAVGSDVTRIDTCTDANVDASLGGNAGYAFGTGYADKTNENSLTCPRTSDTLSSAKLHISDTSSQESTSPPVTPTYGHASKSSNWRRKLEGTTHAAQKSKHVAVTSDSSWIKKKSAPRQLGNTRNKKSSSNPQPLTARTLRERVESKAGSQKVIQTNTSLSQVDEQSDIAGAPTEVMTNLARDSKNHIPQTRLFTSRPAGTNADIAKHRGYKIGIDPLVIHMPVETESLLSSGSTEEDDNFCLPHQMVSPVQKTTSQPSGVSHGRLIQLVNSDAPQTVPATTRCDSSFQSRSLTSSVGVEIGDRNVAGSSDSWRKVVTRSGTGTGKAVSGIISSFYGSPTIDLPSSDSKSGHTISTGCKASSSRTEANIQYRGYPGATPSVLGSPASNSGPQVGDYSAEAPVTRSDTAIQLLFSPDRVRFESEEVPETEALDLSGFGPPEINRTAELDSQLRQHDPSTIDGSKLNQQDDKETACHAKPQESTETSHYYRSKMLMKKFIARHDHESMVGNSRVGFGAGETIEVQAQRISQVLNQGNLGESVSHLRGANHDSRVNGVVETPSTTADYKQEPQSPSLVRSRVEWLSRSAERKNHESIQPINYEMNFNGHQQQPSYQQHMQGKENRSHSTGRLERCASNGPELVAKVQTDVSSILSRSKSGGETLRSREQSFNDRARRNRQIIRPRLVANDGRDSDGSVTKMRSVFEQKALSARGETMYRQPSPQKGGELPPSFNSKHEADNVYQPASMQVAGENPFPSEDAAQERLAMHNASNRTSGLPAQRYTWTSGRPHQPPDFSTPAPAVVTGQSRYKEPDTHFVKGAKPVESKDGISKVISNMQSTPSETTSSELIHRSYGLGIADNNEGYDDGVTLDLSIADVSCLTNPTCLRSKEGTSFEECSSSRYSREVEPHEAECRGPSEASSSQTSEAAAPLLALVMRAKFTNSSDDYGQFAKKSFSDRLSRPKWIPLAEPIEELEGVLNADSDAILDAAWDLTNISDWSFARQTREAKSDPGGSSYAPLVSGAWHSCREKESPEWQAFNSSKFSTNISDGESRNRDEPRGSRSHSTSPKRVQNSSRIRPTTMASDTRRREHTPGSFATRKKSLLSAENNAGRKLTAEAAGMTSSSKENEGSDTLSNRITHSRHSVLLQKLRSLREARLRRRNIFLKNTTKSEGHDHGSSRPLLNDKGCAGNSATNEEWDDESSALSSTRFGGLNFDDCLDLD